MYMSKFFKTKEQALAFRKANKCGVIYSYTKGSRTKKDYIAEAEMREMTEEQVEQYPYVVAWNQK